ncbi:MAG: hypothetical protein LBT94_09155, partial [Prevotellaceae bacterium]|jgi:predicted transcriptional regulator|nr:hypothetical protein [Prevotellaceae bacterium]
LSNIGYEAYSITDLMTKIGLKSRPKFFSRYIQPALQAGLVEMTIPEKPNSRLQKYRLTVSGVELKSQLEKNREQDNEHIREQVGIQVGEQVNKLLSNIGYEAYSITDLMTKIGLKNRPKFFSRYIQPALQAGLVEMTIPEKPNSRLQKYRLTVSGVELKRQLIKP